MAPKKQALRVLIIGDEPLIESGLSELQKNGAKIKSIVDTDDLNEICEQKYDLCFIDIRLPGLKGLIALQLIKKMSPKTKVVSISHNFLADVIKNQIKELSAAYIEKPYDASTIEKTAETITKYFV
jgi:DNA-binding NtrC family response regulator